MLASTRIFAMKGYYVIFYHLSQLPHDIIEFNPVFLAIVFSHIRPRAMIIASSTWMLRIWVKDCDHIIALSLIRLMCEATMVGSHQHQDSVPLTPTPCQDQQLYVDLPPENVSTECETTSTQDQPLSVDLPSKNVETSPIQRKHSTEEATDTQTSIADIANGNIENDLAGDLNATFLDLTGLIKVPNK